MSAASDVLSSLWFVPTFVPVASQALTFLHDNFLYRNNEYADQVNLLKNTNKVGKAKALRAFVESNLTNPSLPGASDDRLEERCMELTSELTRRGALDQTLQACKRSYNWTSSLSFYCFLSGLILGVLGLCIGLALPWTQVWWFAGGMTLATVSVVCTVRLKLLSSRLNILKENEDLRG